MLSKENDTFHVEYKGFSGSELNCSTQSSGGVSGGGGPGSCTGRCCLVANVPAHALVLYAGMVTLDFGIKRFGLEAVMSSFLPLLPGLGNQREAMSFSFFSDVTVTTDTPDCSAAVYCTPRRSCRSLGSRPAASSASQSWRPALQISGTCWRRSSCPVHDVP